MSVKKRNYFMIAFIIAVIEACYIANMFVKSWIIPALFLIAVISLHGITYSHIKNMDTKLARIRIVAVVLCELTLYLVFAQLVMNCIIDNNDNEAALKTMNALSMVSLLVSGLVATCGVIFEK